MEAQGLKQRSEQVVADAAVVCVSERRDELLSRVVAAAADGGLARRSLRDLAAQVGTSHRMLIHHFGSRDGLLAAVVESVERDQIERLGELPADPAEAVRATWQRTSDPSFWPVERLFFECYAAGCAGRAAVRPIGADAGRSDTGFAEGAARRPGRR